MENEGKRLTIVSAALMAVSAAASLLYLDWMWVIAAAIGLFVLSIPRLAMGKGLTYHKKLLIISLIPFSLYLMLFTLDHLVEIDAYVYRWISLIIQPLAVMACAYMLFVSVDANSEMIISKRWLFAFSVAFACAFAVISLFFVFYAMKEMGFPLYNEDFDGTFGDFSSTPSNRYVMLPVNLAVVLSIAYGLLIDRSLIKVDAKDVTRYYGGEEE